MLLELAKVILEPLGYCVFTFRDGESALRAYMASKEPPRLIITDYAMHEMNGLALIEACRQVRPGQKTLMLSGTVDEDVCVSADSRPDSFLAKPYQPKELIQVVQALLGKNEGKK